MAVIQQGSNIVVDDSVAGSLFPTSERELAFPVLVDGTGKAVRIEGALYGRALELRGNARVDGPVVVRGDTRLAPRAGSIRLNSGITVNGSLNVALDEQHGNETLIDRVENASVVIRGDVAVNQNVALRNTIVFGSLRAVNCTLENSLVLGTCLVDEHLKVVSSSVGGYASRDVQFEGHCVMLHALGESRTKPLFLPAEQPNGTVLDCDLRFYPAIREFADLMNRGLRHPSGYPAYSKLYPSTDWVLAQATANPALNEQSGGAIAKWILSIGGRIADLAKIAEAITSLTTMLKCGFEFDHYHPARRAGHLNDAMKQLTAEERWILQSVCQ